MKKRYLVVIFLLMIFSISNVKALTIGDCKVLVSFKLNSSLDEDSYICKGTSYGNSNEKIYYDGTGNTISLNNFDAYYFTNEDEDLTIKVTGSNNIQLLHIGDVMLNITGDGSLKFKQSSFAKKVVNGEAVYQFFYNNKVILSTDKKIFEGTVEEFVNGYNDLVELNKLPKEYNEADYELVQAEDYVKMTGLAITDSWFTNKVKTSLNTSIDNGYGVIKYVAPTVESKTTTKTEEKKTDESVLKTDNVVLISKKKVNKKYKLKEKNLKSSEIAEQVSDTLEDGKELVDLYDVSVYNGSKIVEMKNGKYTIKIKLDDDVENYENYQIIYVNDDGEIAEYIDGKVEDGYIVFETTHLSQYGIIADQISLNTVSNVDNSVSVKKDSINIKLILKLSILLLVATGSSIVLIFLIYKSKHIKKKTRKRA